MKIAEFSRRRILTIQGMAKSDNKEKHYFQNLEAGSDSFVQVIGGIREESKLPLFPLGRVIEKTLSHLIN